MNVDAFIQERRGSWRELEGLLRAAKGRPARLGADGVRRLGELYRSAAADLATARRRFPRDPVVARLEDLVLRARSAVYGSAGRRRSAWAFFSRTYWQRVREQRWALVLSAFLLLAPTAVGTAWGLADPPAAARITPGAAEGIGHRRPHPDLGLSTDERSAMAAQIMTNNIGVTFAAFAGGVTLGLGTAAALLFNGLTLGVVAGLAFGAGNADTFVELIVPHGVLELSCIVVAGAAGLRLGRVIVDPGRGRRGPAVTAEGRRAVQLVVGTAPWLVVAGLVEGFITPTGIGPVMAGLLGGGLGATFWLLVWWRGGSDEGARLEAEVRDDARRGQRAGVGLDDDGAGLPEPAGHH
jgi:uncharacterized membrane protein SpoIIM required for sporulation